MAKTIELKFGNQEDKIVTISLNDPVEPVDEGAVTAAMDAILLQNVFTSSGGELISKKSARVVERNVTDIPLT